MPIVRKLGKAEPAMQPEVHSQAGALINKTF